MSLPSRLAITVLVCALPAAAQAQSIDADAFAARLSGMFAASGVDVDFGVVTGSGDSITMNGIMVAPEGEEQVSADVELVFTGVSQAEDGSYLAEAASFDTLGMVIKDFSLEATDLRWENILVPAEGQVVDPEVSLQMPSSITLGETIFFAEGEEVARVGGFSTSSTPDAEGGELTGLYSVTGIHADLSKIDDDDMRGALDMFGVDTLDMEISGESLWNVDSGLFSLSESAISLAGVGGTNLTLQIGGYDLDLVRMLGELQASFARGDSDGDAEEQGEQVMAAMVEALDLQGGSLRFEDEGITGRVLDFMSSEAEAPRPIMVIGLAAGVPAMAAGMGASQELQTQLVTAVSAFLNDPQSLEIRFEPKKPVPFTDLQEFAENEDSAALLNALGLTVTANQ